MRSDLIVIVIVVVFAIYLMDVVKHQYLVPHLLKFTIFGVG